jgi:hypothetical protein
VAWLAGLLEGEGYFGMINSRVGGKVYRYPRIGVNMTDRDVVDRVGAMWGIKTFAWQPPPPSKKTQYRVMISGWAAADWMRLLHPWLGIRRQFRITEILAEYDAQEPTQKRRSRSCSEAAAKRSRRADGTFERSA